MTDHETANAGQIAPEASGIRASDEVASLLNRPVSPKALAGGEPISYRSYDARDLTLTIMDLQALIPGAAKCTTLELVGFLIYCANNRLDPFRRQCHLVKYSEKEPASYVVSWEVFLDRAQRHAQFDGFERGVVWQLATTDGTETTRERGRPTTYAQDDAHVIVGAWATAYRKDRRLAVDEDVPSDEIIKLRYDPQSRQKVRTRAYQDQLTTMLTKVAAARALRHAFADELGGQYIAEEMQFGQPEMTQAAADVPKRKDRVAPLGPADALESGGYRVATLSPGDGPESEGMRLLQERLYPRPVADAPETAPEDERPSCAFLQVAAAVRAHIARVTGREPDTIPDQVIMDAAVALACRVTKRPAKQFDDDGAWEGRAAEFLADLATNGINEAWLNEHLNAAETAPGPISDVLFDDQPTGSDC
uniref:Putative DNA recombination protein n=1 Tax=viral metagenome TaxID=1070528 RepID=A0A6M3KCG1_9ZZZZ